MTSSLAATASRLLQRLTSRVLPSDTSDPSRRFQFMSDLHLELCQQYTTFDFPVTAPYLILGGDIGRLIDHDGLLAFLQRQTARYERVFFILGNHEFHGMSYEEAVHKASQLENEPSLEGKATLLHQGRYDLDLPSKPNITILGCVLWSQIAAESADKIGMMVSDFKEIRGWSTTAHSAAHASDRSWLQSKLRRIREEDAGQAQPRDVIVVTHHAPLVKGTASPQHEGNVVSSAFATDLCVGEEWSSVKHWVFGHTHWTTELESRNGVRVVSNQRGYVFPRDKRPVDQRPVKHTFDPSRYILC
ncbi:putative calcineurin-like phosphoesterase [Emericellopsis atlantica]|uniref:Calcineurin-like phosphoesterase n=1 Tax=Emericellopsis atlantica TaxID=2614577 RepID=A0A9P8CQ78_9HYPO|nr:putative calcineurin-like phosphoesterase [Emericellopsis atlantica]KAG9253471.1 putative calcineurin-like phosphoesterase [Emericellopsis atlantica]